MCWRMANLQLNKGSIFPLYGDSVPIFRKDLLTSDDFAIYLPF